MNKLIDLTNLTKLSQILYKIGCHFYKCDDLHLTFDLVGDEVYAIKDDSLALLIFKIKNNCLCDINEYLKTIFIFPKTEIVVKDWEKYIVEE